MTAFAFVGSLVAYRRKRRNPDVDPVPIVVRWSILGLLIGLVVAVPRAILNGPA